MHVHQRIYRRFLSRLRIFNDDMKYAAIIDSGTENVYNVSLMWGLAATGKYQFYREVV